jgi:hypothetical protein
MERRFRAGTDARFSAVSGAVFSLLPSAALLDAVEQALYGHELMGFNVQIKAPDVTDITMTVEFAGDADWAAAALAAESCVHGLGMGGRFAVRELCALPKPFNRTA